MRYKGVEMSNLNHLVSAINLRVLCLDVPLFDYELHNREKNKNWKSPQKKGEFHAEMIYRKESKLEGVGWKEIRERES